MTLNLRLAKSIMEREEGMNHLWIQLSPMDCSISDQAEVSIALPHGLYRMPNLNGYKEWDSNGILIHLSRDKDILLELYTQRAVDFDEACIMVTLRFKDAENRWNKFSQMISVRFGAEEEIEKTLVLDQQVIKRVKELRNHAISEPHSDDFVIVRPRIYELTDNEYAYLEKKYRVDY